MLASWCQHIRHCEQCQPPSTCYVRHGASIVGIVHSANLLVLASSDVVSALFALYTISNSHTYHGIMIIVIKDWCVKHYHNHPHHHFSRKVQYVKHHHYYHLHHNHHHYHLVIKHQCVNHHRNHHHHHTLFLRPGV